MILKEGDDMHIYLMRHGKTIFNEKNITQGWCDSLLLKHRSGLCAASVTTLLPKLGMAEHLSVPTMQSAPPS